MVDVEKAFPERLKAQREANGLTQEELGQTIGAGKVPISRYESGHVLPNVQNVVKLAVALNCSTDFLLGRTEHPLSIQGLDYALTSAERAMLAALRNANVARALGLVGMVLEDAMEATEARSARPMGRMVNTDLLGLRVTESPVVVMRGREPEKGGP